MAAGGGACTAGMISNSFSKNVCMGMGRSVKNSQGGSSARNQGPERTHHAGGNRLPGGKRAFDPVEQLLFTLKMGIPVIDFITNLLPGATVGVTHPRIGMLDFLVTNPGILESIQKPPSLPFRIRPQGLGDVNFVIPTPITLTLLIFPPPLFISYRGFSYPCFTSRRNRLLAGASL